MGASEPELVQARAALASLFGTPANQATRRQRIALIGLRGAGKSTLGRLLAESWQVPFVELNRSIEAVAGCSLAEIHSLYGPAAYRRYEKRALEDTIRRYPRGRHRDARRHRLRPGDLQPAARRSATPCGCRATPEEHMEPRRSRRATPRPMAARGNREAMNDLRRILESRAAFYAKADEVFETSGRTIEAAFAGLRAQLEPEWLRPDARRANAEFA